MTRSFPALLTAVAVMIVATGCLSVTSYVDPGLRKVGYADSAGPSRSEAGGADRGVPPQRRAGGGAAAAARDAVRAVVEKSKLFPAVLDKPGDDVDRLELVLDNVADLGAPPATAR